MYETKRFNSISIRLASPETIKEWSHGEVKKPETINYRTQKPEPDGLFCEKIFGPTKSWECHCGKYKKIRYKGRVCDKCGVEITKNTVRRERMGHIKLAAPVSHIWYYKGVPSRISLLLDIKPKQLDRVLYFAAYIVLDPGTTDLEKKQIIDEATYREYCEKYGKNNFKAMMGAEAIKILLEEIDIEKLCAELNEQRIASSGQKRVRIIKQLEVAEAFRTSGNKPQWMILENLPVLPPELRPMVPLDGGRYATSDLNDLYRRVINRNNRLNKLKEIGAPDIIIRNEKRMLQEAVDALIDNGRRGRPVTGSTSATSNRNLKSLTDLLKGKQGRFRQNLLGKRVDYSGRSVIVVGPELKMWQCGLPKEMARELFKPFVIKKLVDEKLTANIKTGRRMVDRGGPEVWDILEEIIKDHPVMLNRAPTLHRLGIQAFEPVLVEGRAIKLHPLVCTGFNADFDGDQMAVHVPLSAEAQAEARFLMLSTNNLLKPQDGKPVTIPTQDMILGCYYITGLNEGAKGEGMVFTDIDEAFMAYDEHHITFQTKIGIRLSREIDGKKISKIIYSSFGRFIFNEIIPQNLGYVDRTDPDKLLDLECDFQVGKKKLGDIIARCIEINGNEVTVELLDNVKAMGYHYSTIGGVSIGIGDMQIPDVKNKMIAEADKKVEEVTKMYQRGFLNNDGRYKNVVKIWNDTTAAITEELKSYLKPDNPIMMMADSGARGDINQIKQLAGMRGTFSDTSGKAIEIPIKSNLREGMNVLEFFISSHGARKALSDTALKTANSGYLTRRLVDVSQQVIISEADCGTEDFTYVKEITTTANEKTTVVKKLSERLAGRYAAEDIVDPKTGELFVKKNELISNITAGKIEDALGGQTKVKIRTAFDCISRHGICSKCYGINLATGAPTTGGEVVGIMAAQSIGEPGTQLTMRTFHTGGIATNEDITTGLPRVEEIFENQSPKGVAVISEVDGIVRIEDGKDGKRIITVTPEPGATTIDPDGNEIPETEKQYTISKHATICVKDGQVVEKSDNLTDGPVNLNEILALKGERKVEKYIVSEVIKVYKAGGIAVSDKHIEIITRQMLRRVKIEEPGDTNFTIGSIVDRYEYEDVNKQMEAEGKTPAVAKNLVLGISKASVTADSFMSAASFQESAKVLTDAAVKGKTDPLIGLKENVMIGNIIPAGTGKVEYHKITAVPVIKENAKIITGREYDATSEDASRFDNEYLDEVKLYNEELDEEERRANAVDAE